MPTHDSNSCLNCGAPLVGPYCAQCGQRVPRTELTLRELLGDVTNELASWEGKTPRTVKALFLEPGRLTSDFLAGRRARWLPPLRLYLICSVAFFLSGPFVEGVTHRAARQISTIDDPRANADGKLVLTPALREEIRQSLPARIFGADRMERAVDHADRLRSTIDSAYPRTMFLLLPLFALFTSVAWRRSRPQYPEHLYVALHIHAAIFGIFAIATIATMFFSPTVAASILGLTAVPYTVWYVLTSFRRVFGDSWPRTVAKTAVIAAVYSVCLFAVSLGMLAYVLFTL